MNIQALQLTIVALLGGMAIPLIVQLFLTARTVQRVALSTERKLDETRRELHALLAGGRRETAAAEWTSTLASAAVPALIAAVRAFRESISAESGPRSNTNGRTQQERAP
jgi:hypothetical protein